MSRNMLTSQRIITCIPEAIQTDGSCVASLRDLLEGDPDVGTHTKQIHFVQLNYVLCGVFAQIRSHKSNIIIAIRIAKCKNLMHSH